MIIVTTIDIPDYVYDFFQKEAEPWKNKTAEDMMAGYLARHVRRTLESREKKAQAEKEQNSEL